jgi:serine/threonine-protein kinase RsbW
VARYERHLSRKTEVSVSEFLPGNEAVAGAQDDADDPDGIELRIGARLEQLPIIRSLAATVAIRADFDLDSIADLKLAVDEACSTLITRAIPGSGLTCRFLLRDDEIRFVGMATSASEAEPRRDSFGWRVLTTLTDEASAWVKPNESGHVLHIEIIKRRTTGG